MRLFWNDQSGFTFIEALIAFSIVGIFLALTWGTIQFLLQQSQTQIMRSRAHFFAEEGLEVVRHLRDSAVLNQRVNGFDQQIGSKDGRYIVVHENDRWVLSPESFERIYVEAFPPAYYCRTLYFYDESDGVKEIGVDVKWSREESCENSDDSVYYSTYLANILF